MPWREDAATCRYALHAPSRRGSRAYQCCPVKGVMGRGLVAHRAGACARRPVLVLLIVPFDVFLGRLPPGEVSSVLGVVSHGRAFLSRNAAGEGCRSCSSRAGACVRVGAGGQPRRHREPGGSPPVEDRLAATTVPPVCGDSTASRGRHTAAGSCSPPPTRG